MNLCYANQMHLLEGHRRRHVGKVAGLSEASHGPVQGTVTQVTDVKPLLTVATYLDRNQATEAYQEVSGESRIPEMPHKAPSLQFLKMSVCW